MYIFLCVCMCCCASFPSSDMCVYVNILFTHHPSETTTTNIQWLQNKKNTQQNTECINTRSRKKRKIWCVYIEMYIVLKQQQQHNNVQYIFIDFYHLPYKVLYFLYGNVCMAKLNTLSSAKSFISAAITWRTLELDVKAALHENVQKPTSN